jgi:hypothetical protein
MEDFMQMQDDLDLNKAFEIIVSTRQLSDIIHDISNLIRLNQLARTSLEKLLKKHKINSLLDLKEELLDLILQYINIILNDNELSQKEIRNVNFLKKIFQIHERDLYKYRYEQMKEILQKQLIRIYSDNFISPEESLHKVGLQEIFSLSYDQFLEFANREDIISVEKGADIIDLDTVLRQSVLSKIHTAFQNTVITNEIKEIVIERDGMKCNTCGSGDALEFEYIIPISKGGSNTARNVHLVCNKCAEVTTNY